MTDAEVDEIDLALLGALQADSRAPIAALSRAAAVSRATVYTRLARLREIGVIKSLTASVDPYRVGLSLAAVVLLRASTDTWRKWSSFASAFDEMPEVEFAADLAGEFDMMLLARFRDADHLRSFIESDLRRLQGIAGIRTLLVLNESPRCSLLLPRQRS
jgi:DNA-binding Lrp family transcriptional regulator